MSRGGSKPGERRGGRCKGTPNKRTMAVADRLKALGRDPIEGLAHSPRFTREQLRQELEVGGDIPDLVSGRLAPQALRLTARTLVLMRYGKYFFGLLLFGSASAITAGDLYVDGYYRSDGTYVRPYIRSTPDSSIDNNYGPSQSDSELMNRYSRDYDCDGIVISMTSPRIMTARVMSMTIIHTDAK
jgi:hypothetical protein